MSLIAVNTQPSLKQLKNFGLFWLVFFGALTAWRVFGAGSETSVIALGSIAVVVPVIGLFRPPFIRLVFVGLSYATFPIGVVVSQVLLALVFYGLLTPIRLIARIFGYDPLHRRLDPKVKTYWSPRKPVADTNSYFRQF